MSKPVTTSRLNVRLSLFGLAVAAFGLLLWARLILVTGHPRIATANPTTQVEPSAQPAPESRATSAQSASEPQPN